MDLSRLRAMTRRCLRAYESGTNGLAHRRVKGGARMGDTVVDGRMVDRLAYSPSVYRSESWRMIADACGDALARYVTKQRPMAFTVTPYSAKPPLLCTVIESKRGAIRGIAAYDVMLDEYRLRFDVMGASKKEGKVKSYGKKTTKKKGKKCC